MLPPKIYTYCACSFSFPIIFKFLIRTAQSVNALLEYFATKSIMLTVFSLSINNLWELTKMDGCVSGQMHTVLPKTSVLQRLKHYAPKLQQNKIMLIYYQEFIIINSWYYLIMQDSEGVRHVCVPLILVTYSYLEFHVTLNSHNTKPANTEAQWGLVDI